MTWYQGISTGDFGLNMVAALVTKIDGIEGRLAPGSIVIFTQGKKHSTGHDEARCATFDTGRTTEGRLGSLRRWIEVVNVNGRSNLVLIELVRVRFNDRDHGNSSLWSSGREANGTDCGFILFRGQGIRSSSL